MLSVFEKMKALLGISNVITWCLTHHHQWTPCGTWDTPAAWDYRMKSLKHSRAVKVCSPDIFWQLFSFCVFCFQLLGFEVDSINSVQFSNHTGQATDLACVSLSSCVPALCGCVWVSQFPRCRDEVLASVNRHGSLRGSDRAEADDSTDKWVSVEVSGCMLRHQNSLETQI